MEKGKKERLKEMIERLHAGEDPDKVKEEFKEVIKDTSPTEIARIEDELVREGLPREKLHKLCDVHLSMFKENLEGQGPVAPEGHPVHTLMEEHKFLLKLMGMLRDDIDGLAEAGGLDAAGAKERIEHIGHIVDHLKESERHYLREENVLFPYLEKHGIKEPPAVMWMEHDRIREMKKNLYSIYDGRADAAFDTFRLDLKEVAIALSEMLSNHFFKENNILFPAAVQTITRDEWVSISHEFDEVGYCCFTPKSARRMQEATASATGGEKGMIDFETGSFTPEELEALMDTLPVDMTFVDRDDKVRYFSQGKDRVFVRTKAVIGREVQKCHPQKSVHVVQNILDDFKAGKRDVAEFWINLQGTLIYIRYFAVRDKAGKYIGTLEVTQDLTPIKKIEGEKRLLDG